MKTHGNEQDARSPPVKGREAAAVPAHRSAGWCHTRFLSGTKAASSGERAETSAVKVVTGEAHAHRRLLWK